MSNQILWAIITAWVGSLMAYLGFGLIVVAISTKQEDGPAPAPVSVVKPQPV
ncbi:MAG: hypothetical protein AAF568_06255 [Pseudomonadota bacterium]